MAQDSKPDRSRLALVLGMALATGGLLSGCIVVPAGRAYGGRPQELDDGEIVVLAPPPPQVEVVVAAPGPGYFWIAGHWGWMGGRHAWVGGRWESHRPGWRWVPFGWAPYRQGWRASPGRWERH